VELAQDDAYGDIVISRTSHFARALADHSAAVAAA
jgi:hypothetical protein